MLMSVVSVDMTMVKFFRSCFPHLKYFPIKVQVKTYQRMVEIQQNLFTQIFQHFGLHRIAIFIHQRKEIAFFEHLGLVAAFLLVAGMDASGQTSKKPA